MRIERCPRERSDLRRISNLHPSLPKEGNSHRRAAMNQPNLRPAILFFYAYALALCAALICRDVPTELGITQATALGMIAWLLVNRRRLADD
jgi:hypothetical protein